MKMGFTCASQKHLCFPETHVPHRSTCVPHRNPGQVQERRAPLMPGCKQKHTRSPLCRTTNSSCCHTPRTSSVTPSKLPRHTVVGTRQSRLERRHTALSSSLTLFSWANTATRSAGAQTSQQTNGQTTNTQTHKQSNPRSQCDQAVSHCSVGALSSDLPVLQHRRHPH